MNNYLILFAVSGILMLIAELIKRFFVKDFFQKESNTNNIAESLSGIIFVIAWVIFFITLTFAIYIFIFNY